MRIYLTAIFIFFATTAAAFADDAAEFMKRGIMYYLKKDYAPAKEMFANVSSSDTQTKGAAAYYLGAIAATEGDEKAYGYFETAIKTAPKDIAEMSLAKLVKYAWINNNWKKLSQILNNDNIKTKDGTYAFYLAEALWYLDKKSESKSVLENLLKEGFADKNCEGADMFVDAVIKGDDFVKSVDLKTLNSSSTAAKARLDLLNKTASLGDYPQAETSLFAQVLRAEKGKDFDVDTLSKTFADSKNSLYAWQAALAIGQKYFSQKEYQKAYEYAKEAEFLASPDMGISWSAYMLEGDALRLLKKYNEACDAYLKIAMSKAARGEPQAESLYKVGLCWFEQGDWIRAHTYFQRVFIVYFKFEYWGSRAYYYDARALYSMKLRREANATLVEYFRRAKDKTSPIYLEAKKFYDGI